MGIRKYALAFENAVKAQYLRILPRLLPAGPEAVCPALESLQSLLLIRPDRLGDFVLSVPALAALEKNLRPETRVTLVAGKRAAGLARAFFPGMNIITYHKTPFSLLRILGYLVFHRFDAVIDFHSHPFSATSGLMTLAARCRNRIGFKGAGQDAASAIYNMGAPSQDDDLHEQDRNFYLLRPLGILPASPAASKFPRLTLPADTQWEARQFYLRHNVTDDIFVVGLHPTLMKTDNRWAQEKYYHLMAQLSRLDHVKVVVLWGKGEEQNRRTFLPSFLHPRNILVLPSNDLFYMLEAGRRFNVLVCNDSGLMHLLALVSNLVVIWGKSSLKRWAPLGSMRRIILNHESGDCNAVEVDEVMAAVNYFVTEWQEQRGERPAELSPAGREESSSLAATV